jgi:hypothetical protein
MKMLFVYAYSNSYLSAHMRKIIFVCSLLLWGIVSHAQLSFEPRQFVIDLEDYMGKSGTREGKDAAAEFASYFARFSNAQKIQIVNQTNTLINRGYGYPAITDYLLAINGLIVNNQIGSFDGWHKAAQLAMNESKESFRNYVGFSRNTFYDKILAKTGAATWMIDNMEIVMDMRGQPSIVFKNTNVYSYTAGDTITIFGTTGKYLPASNEWQGRGGRYNWSRVGMDSSEISAKLISYVIRFDKGELIADSAELVYPQLISEPVMGRLTDKPFAKSMGDRSVYPKFETHRRNFQNLPFGEAKLNGGFSLTGKTLRGIGSDTSKAELVFEYKRKTILKVRSDDFVVRNDRVLTQKAEIIIVLEKDSIYHTQVQFLYRFKDRFIQINRMREGIGMAPFYNTYHNVEFYADELRWDMENPKIEVDMINDDEPAKFESINYYRDYAWEKLGGILNYHPLQRVKTFSEQRKNQAFSIQEYADAFRATTSDVRQLMTILHDQGFIEYDVKRQQVKIRRKLQDYVNAHYGRTDFDVITFYSTIRKYPNATISLINNDLQIQGVPRFQFSDSQNVYVIPKDQIITLKKNRGLDFAGKIRAGKVEFYGSGFDFDYTRFQVRLNNVDSMKFYFRDEQKGIDVPIKSVLSDVYGTLSIDHPNNKSGRRRYPGYPIFKSDKGSNIYYDKQITQKGVYVRDKFYFEVEPFTLENLSKLDFKQFTLNGTMRAASIVPDFKYVVSVQNDLSFGFIKKAESTGYPMYGNKGAGVLDLSLSEAGFYGSGEINYISSTSISDSFYLFIDSLNANCESFKNEQTLIFPSAIGSQTYNHWMPYNDSMYVTPRSTLISFSENRGLLDGSLVITPERLAAMGNINIAEAQLNSNSFWLQPNNILSDSATFRILDASDPKKFSFNTATVSCNVDLSNRTGSFIYNNKGINTYFNYNEYVGSYDRFLWKMDKKALNFSASKTGQTAFSNLVSVRKSQDSLKYETAETLLDLTDLTIYAMQVPFIRIADGFIYPDSNKVIVKKDANMDMLYNAKIIADTINKFHTIEQCNVGIYGRFNIEAEGVYQYFDNKKQRQLFYMNTIKVDATSKRIIGKTEIPDSANFYVGKKIRFYGNANLISTIRNLEYEGFFLPLHELNIPKSDWFRSAAVINPDSVYIKVNTDIRNQNRQAMMVGLNVANDSTHIYPLFFTRKRAGSDPELIRVDGILYYDEKLDVFKMGDYKRIFSGVQSGNYIELNDSKKQLYYEGELNTGVSKDQFTFNTFGKAMFNSSDTSFNMNVSGLLNFPLPSSVVRIMFDTLNNQSGSAKQITPDPAILKPLIMNVVKESRNKQRVLDDLNDKTIRMVSELEKSFFFSHLNFIWDQPTRSFITQGELSINSIEKFRIERMINGRIQIIKKRTGDDFIMLLESAEGSWYYFKYQRGIMFALSSDAVFNRYLRDDSDKFSKKFDNYKIRLANISEKNKFVRSYKTDNQK